MYHFATVATVALSLSVSALVIPRATPPSGYDSSRLESYDTYHTRYMALSCNTKHSTEFFEQCCHPLLANEGLSTRPAQCNPDSASVSGSAVDLEDNADDDLPFCDEDDGDDVPPTDAPAPAGTSTPAAPAPAPAPSPPADDPIAKTTPSAPAPPSTDSGSATVNKGGFATFFYQNGVAGACGTVHQDSDMIAAINGERYGNLGQKSALCGKQVRLTNTKNNKSVTVTIADACPTCNNNNSIDLSEGAFKQIATLDEGLVPIEWSFL
jgi:hypothetical protein